MLRRILVGLVLCLLSGTVVAQSGQFLVAPQYSTGSGTNPQAAAVGDFNKDGNLDVVVANKTTNTVSVLLGKGDGTFATHVDYTTGSKPMGVAVGDFNGDGVLDVAVSNANSNTVSILLGHINGSGTFTLLPKVDYATGVSPQGIAVGHFTGSSGHLDLVVTNSGASPGSVGVLLGNGDGTFGTQVTYTTSSNPTSVAVGDVNGDGIQDLVVANNNNNNVVSVLLGNGTAGVGNGTFGSQTQYLTAATTSAANPVSVALADLGNGNLDILVANQQANSVGILLGNGDGTFATYKDYPTAGFPTGVVVGDFNGDGKPDVAVSSGDGNTVSVLWGLGDGHMTGQVNTGSGNVPSAVVAGDFNNDGKLDLLTADSGDNTVTAILNYGTLAEGGPAYFQARADFAAGTTPFSIAAADFNADGALDLAVTNTGTASAVSILLGNGNGTFEGPNHYSTGTSTNPYGLAVGNFTGNNVPDLAVTNYESPSGTIGIMLSQGAGTGSFQSPNTIPVGSDPASVAVGDVNGDGIPDLVVANYLSNNVTVLLGNGTAGVANGTFTEATNSPYSVGNGPVAIALQNLHGNQALDIVVVNESDDTVSILKGNGDGTFLTPATYSTGPTGGLPQAITAGDFNNTGKYDLAVANFSTKKVAILMGNGDGTFQNAVQFSVGANPSSVVVGDFNGDGKPDLALTSIPSGGNPGNLVTLLLGNGDGTFQAPALYGVGSLSYSAVVGDFNEDGALDLAVANGRAGSVSILLNTQGTNIYVGSSAPAAVYGQPITLNTTVAASVALFGPTPTGTVTIQNGSTVLGTGPLASGAYSVTTTTLPLGTNHLSAIYSGDSNYQAHTFSFTQTVQQAGSTTSLLSSASTVLPNQAVTFTANVASNTSGVPTGSVTFLDGANPIGSAPLTSVNGNGVATLTISTLAAGTHSITAAYSGNVDFRLSTSPALTEIVQLAPDFSLAASTLSQTTIAPGGSATSTITVTPVGGLNPSTVTLTCSVTPVVTPAASCSLGAVTVANSVGTATLTVKTVGSQTALAAPAGQRGSGATLAFALLVPAMLLGGAGLNKPNRRKLLGLCLMFLVLGGCVFQVACGGSSSSTTAPASGTPAGTYTVTITGSANGTHHSSSPLTFTVN